MKKVSVFLVLFFCSFSLLFAQENNSPVLMTITGEKVTSKEFLDIYRKNSIKDEPVNQEALREYLELFINYKLKVKEAEELGLDTSESFKNELSGYRSQLAQPYLTDKEVTEQLIREAYERMKYDIRGSHILIKVDANAFPKDTLEAYNKIMKIRDRALKGESFEELAIEYSEDQSARGKAASEGRLAIKGNAGDLGYFSVFDMIYPFETAAYNTKVGGASIPVRTDYGYHIIKITDRKPAMGKVQVAHIMVTPESQSPEDSIKARDKIFDIYEKLKGGQKFEDLAIQFSDDKGSAKKGGLLPWFGVNRMVPEFIVGIASIKNIGGYTKPVYTQYGWHLIKLIERKEMGTFDELESEIKMRVSKDVRSQKGREVLIGKTKEEYGFKEFPEALKEIIALVDSSVFEGKWYAEKASGMQKPIMAVGDKTYVQEDFAKFISDHQLVRQPEPVDMYVKSIFRKFVDDNCIAYEDANLENKYPAFKSIMKEYHDGILLFELTDQKVWSKAVKDTSGLESFHKANKMNYMWDDRLQAAIFICKDEKTAEQARKYAKKAIKKGWSPEDILKKVNKDTIPAVTVESGKFAKSQNSIIDTISWEEGLSSNIQQNKSIVFVWVQKKLPPEPKALNEARGIITADYQNYLEKEWIKYLRKKYPVSVNWDAFSSIK